MSHVNTHHISHIVGNDSVDFSKVASTRKWILISTVVTLFIIQTLFLNVEAIVPIFIDKYHKSLTHTQTALIMM